MTVPPPAILDTSALINYLRVDRTDLLGDLPQFHFLVTDHVRGEINDAYPRQVAALTAALRAGHFEEISVGSPEELTLFAELSATGRLGAGECSAIAAACARSYPLAIDDKRARSEALRRCPGIRLLNTPDLMVATIRAGLLNVAEADSIKDQWERDHRFRLTFGSFGELV